LIRIRLEPPLAVLLVVLVAALEPLDAAVALEVEHVGGDAVEREWRCDDFMKLLLTVQRMRMTSPRC
jgi:hypothetical protein